MAALFVKWVAGVAAGAAVAGGLLRAGVARGQDARKPDNRETRTWVRKALATVEMEGLTPFFGAACPGSKTVAVGGLGGATVFTDRGATVQGLGMDGKRDDWSKTYAVALS